MLEFPGGVYAITPETADTERLLSEVEAALAGGAAAVQYRDNRPTSRAATSRQANSSRCAAASACR